MMTQKTEIRKETLERAIQAVEHETGLRLNVIQWNGLLRNKEIDAIVRLNHVDRDLAIEIKKWAQQANLGALINQIKQLPEEGLLAADYINPKMAEKLRAQNVQFIDCAGNAFINQPPVYVYVTGNRLKEPVYRPIQDNAKRAFEPKGLVLTYSFLCYPELLNAPYREIAEKTGVAVGTVGWVIKALAAGGFIRDKSGKHGRQIINYQKLLDRWVEAWPEKLKPKQFIGNFIADDPYWWKSVEISDFDGFWGGEIAAAQYTNYLKPAVATVYLPEHVRAKFLRETRLRKVTDWTTDNAGTVLIYRPFWITQLDEFNVRSHKDLAHPILVYADLVATGDPRNLEAARMVYDKYLTQHFRED